MNRIPAPALFSLLIFILVPQGSAAPPAAVALPQEVATYGQLVHAIRQARAASQTRVEAAVEQEKVREAWEIGKLIDEHILLHKERADYGEHVIVMLAKDLETSETELRYMLLFARAYPIHPAPDELTWSHYRELLSIRNEAKRNEIAARAVKEKWGHKRIRQEARRLSSKVPVASKILEVATPGKVGTYRVVQAKAGEFKGELVLDLGFSNYYKPDKKLKFQDRDIVALEKGKLKKAEAVEDNLFTYKADVFQMIDGDTFYAVVSLGFGFDTVQKLRLRGLDAPEIETADGQEAKAFVEKILKKTHGSILIKTVKSDKYDRYLADVWVGGTYLNQKLIDEGLAVRVSE